MLWYVEISRTTAPHHINYLADFAHPDGWQICLQGETALSEEALNLLIFEELGS